MSANKKKLVAVALCVVTAALAGFVSGVGLSILGASRLASVSGGAGAFLAMGMFGLSIIGLFEFKDEDTRTPPARTQQGAPTP
ncbi:hypothetical protein [Streptomyces sp. NPDC048496]|uniref:hypothetical protein n=1 Tax=Streptomyces sp. NPDC048496 TaxID=3365558 RepID=UPI0037159E15